jgi:hypothetical protein
MAQQGLDHALDAYAGVSNRGVVTPRLTQDTVVPAKVSEHANERAQSIADANAVVVGRMSDVRDFRTRFLGEPLLTAEEAQDFLTSPPSAATPWAYWCETALLVVRGSREIDVTVLALLGDEGREHLRVRIRTLNREVNFTVRRITPREWELTWIDPSCTPQASPVARHSVLGELAAAANNVSNTYRWPRRPGSF